MKSARFWGYGCAIAAMLSASTAYGQWFVDDFDTYGSCTAGCNTCTADPLLFDANWDPAPGCGIGGITNEYTATCPSGFVGWDEPFSWKINKSAAQAAIRSLIPEIQTASGNPNANAVNGTDENPLTVFYTLWLQADNQKAAQTSMWVQLYAGTNPEMHAPTTAPGVGTCTANVCVGGPMDGQACTSDVTCTAMKLNRTGPTSACNLQDSSPVVSRPAFAVGVYGGENGLVPKPPCANFTNNGLSRLVTFDGDQWWQIKSTTPPGSTGPGMIPRQRVNRVFVTMRTNTYDIAHSYTLTAPVACTGGFCVGGGPRDGQPCTANSFCRNVTDVQTNIPRQYTGPFQTIQMGPGAITDGTSAEFPVGSQYPANVDAIEINGGVFTQEAVGACCNLTSGTCIENVIEAACTQLGASHQWAGAGTTCATAACVQGACCLPNGTCTVTDPVTCSSQSGNFNGPASSCSSPSLTCCPHGQYVWADHDVDGDVDMDDFAHFQLCYTGTTPGLPEGCKCFDRDNNTQIDVDDFNAFKNCVSGPSVPWLPANTPSCVQ